MSKLPTLIWLFGVAKSSTRCDSSDVDRMQNIQDFVRLARLLDLKPLSFGIQLMNV